MFNQVYPAQLSFDGLQLRGARYLFDWPVKLEYSGFVANGLVRDGHQSVTQRSTRTSATSPTIRATP